jgi:hypothetical protein
MELHKATKPANTYGITINDDYLTYFEKAKRFVSDYYSATLATIASTKFDEVSPEFFYREFCWTVCTSGFNAKIVSRFFHQLMCALAPVNSYIQGGDIDISTPRSKALVVFGNARKIDAMIECAKILRAGIENKTWAVYRNEELNTPDKLTKLPYIGEITKFHLARNCGMLDYMKPDLHLTRISSHWGFENPVSLCKSLSKENGMPIGLIDLILFYSLSSFGSK